MALWCQSRMEEGGIVPPHSVLAPGAALRLLRSRALPSAQVGGIVGAPKGAVELDRTERRKEEPSFGPVVRSELPCGNSRSLPWGPTESVLGCGAFVSDDGNPPARRCVWSGPAGRNSHQIRPHLPGSLPGRAAHDSRERYLAKECVGSNRVSKERWQLPVATPTETKAEE